MGTLEIRVASFRDDHDAICHIREQVFIKEQGVPEELEWDGLDDQACHLLAFTQNQKQEQHAIGTVRLLKDGHIGRMAVLPAYRHQGVGRALLEKITQIAESWQLQSVFLNAQTNAVGFYQQQGFIADARVFMDAGIPHQYMHKTLSVTMPENSTTK